MIEILCTINFLARENINIVRNPSIFLSMRQTLPVRFETQVDSDFRLVTSVRIVV